MSRFIEVLNNIDILNPHVILNILETIQTKLDADSSFLNAVFLILYGKKSPVSKHTSPLKIEATIMSEKRQGKNEIIIGVVVPVQTLCPCSKAISSFGALNPTG